MPWIVLVGLKSFTDHGNKLMISLVILFGIFVILVINLISNPNVKTFLSAFDVIFLSETWLTTKQLDMEYLVFGNYTIHSFLKKKQHQGARRGSGGEMILYTSEKVSVNVLENKCDHFVVSCIWPNQVYSAGFTIVISCYIPPKDTTFICTSCCGDYFNQLWGLIAKYRHNNLITVGDINARASSLKDFDHARCRIPPPRPKRGGTTQSPCGIPRSW